MGINNELIRSLGMALVHSLWEGLAVLVLVLVALSLAGKSNARLRYMVLVSGHFLLLTGFITTWYILYHRQMAALHAVNPLARVYSGVQGLVSSSSLAMRTAGYTSSLRQMLEPVYPALALGWAWGFVLMIIRMAGGFYLSYNLIRKDNFMPDPSLLALFEKVKASLRMPTRLKFRLSSRLVSPMVIGLLKPCVIVPAAILSGLNTEQVEAILLHELAHIRRYDHVVMILQAIATQILFFHPVAWYFSAEINRERENCCDDLVIQTFPNPINYIKALTMIQELNVEGQVPANALMGRSKRLLGRVKRLLKTETRHAPVFRMAVIFLLLITLGIAAITIASAGNPETKKSIGTFFIGKKYNMHVVTDTLKVKKHDKVIANKESDNKEDIKKQKELEEAGRKLDKARKELEEARLQMEQAREEYARAGGRLRSHEMSDLSQDRRQPMTDEQMREFKLKHEKEFEEQRRNMELQRRDMIDQYRRTQEDMRDKMRQLRHQDSNLFRKRPYPYMDAFPAEPFPPPEPPSKISAPDIPDVNDLVQPDTAGPMKLLRDDKGTDEKENAEPLDSKLKELEDK